MDTDTHDHRYHPSDVTGVHMCSVVHFYILLVKKGQWGVTLKCGGARAGLHRTQMETCASTVKCGTVLGRLRDGS